MKLSTLYNISIYLEQLRYTMTKVCVSCTVEISEFREIFLHMISYVLWMHSKHLVFLDRLMGRWVLALKDQTS